MAERNDFIRDIIDEDLRTGRHAQVRTRFPPEPNGYLHIGHAKSICLNFGLARDYGGTCNLRYDDTNPTKEDVEYVESIEADVRWLGFEPSAVLFSADYFPRMYAWAEQLVRDGKAYVCDLTDEQIREHRGTLSEPGTPSPYRDRAVEENLDLLRRMKAGEFPDGARVLRAKIDMASANMKMRDPLLYRIRHAHHHRSGDAWCIYPMYDYAHPLEDAIEGITHSICTLEFENNRELYDWVLAATGAGGANPPRQYEFARLSLDYTMMSKRKLLQLVEQGHVTGWDDPRMPTIAGMRRRGYRPEAIRAFCDMIGVAKANSTVDVAKLEFCVRDDLGAAAPRALGVLRPLPVELTGWGDAAETLAAPDGRPLPISGTVLIDRDDYRDDPPPDYLRLAPGRTVRLRHGYCVTCDGVEHGPDGQPARLRATVHRETLGGKDPADGRKVWGVVHWVDAATSVPAEVRLYDRLFKVARPEEGGGDWVANLNPDSRVVVEGARLEASLAAAAPGSRFQLERVGYFIVDEDSTAARRVLNRIITLRDAREARDARPAAAAPTERKENAKAKTRPKSKSPAEYRAEARARDPELAAKFDRAQRAGATVEQADLLAADHGAADFFLELADLTGHGALAAKWLINEVPRAAAEAGREAHGLDAPRLAELLALVHGEELTTAAARVVLARMIATGGRAAEALPPKAAAPTADDVATAVDDLIAAHPAKVEQYRAGKTGLLGFFVGQVMRARPGADPALVGQVVAARLA